MTPSPEELDRLAKVAYMARWGYSAGDWDISLPETKDVWRSTIAAVLEAQGPLTLASLIESHGAAAVYELAKDMKERHVYGPWITNEFCDGEEHRRNVAEAISVLCYPVRDGKWHWSCWAMNLRGDAESREAAQSACDSALRAAGAVLVPDDKERTNA